MRRISRWQGIALCIIVMSGVVYGSNMYGMWYMTIATGFALGLFIRYSGPSVLAGIVSGIAGWGFPLVVETSTIHVRDTARMVAQIMGFGSYGVIVIALTLALGVLLSLSGVWVARSLAMMFLATIFGESRHHLSA